MDERNELICKIQQLVDELKEIGTEKDMQMFYITASITVAAIRDGTAVWKKEKKEKEVS